jgi:uncharacterized protein
MLNIYRKPLESCSLDPLTGFERDGTCNECSDDAGQHTICVEMTEEFLLFSRERGNDLLSPQLAIGFPGLLPGDRWCVCLARWIEAKDAGIVARVHVRATHESVLTEVSLDELEQYAISDG